jgi:SEC-C motif domain protein
MTCPCGSGLTFDNCCAPYIRGEKSAPTAEALMRSRYSAYATVAPDYLVNTSHISIRKNYTKKEIQQWAKTNRWINLKIISTKDGKESDVKGEVIFIASYIDSKGKPHEHFEHSHFVKENNQWLYFSE